jgi:hypothetical protein
VLKSTGKASGTPIGGAAYFHRRADFALRFGIIDSEITTCDARHPAHRHELSF